RGVEREIIDDDEAPELLAQRDEVLDLCAALHAQRLRDLESESLRGDAVGFQAGRDVLQEALVLERGDRQVEREARRLGIPRGAMRAEPRQQPLQGQYVQRSRIAQR